MAAVIVINKVILANDGTADIFVDTNLTENGKYRWIETHYVDKPYFTGWDITDNGFMINFDMSYWANVDCFKTEKQYQSYMKQAIKEFVPVDWTRNVLVELETL